VVLIVVAVERHYDDVKDDITPAVSENGNYIQALAQLYK
jgi:hypothetical protein